MTDQPWTNRDHLWEGYVQEPSDTPTVAVHFTMFELACLMANTTVSRFNVWGGYAVGDSIHDKLGEAKRWLENRDAHLERMRAESRKNANR